MIRLYRPDPTLGPAPAAEASLAVPGGGRFPNADLPFIRYRRVDAESVLAQAGVSALVCLGDFVDRETAERAIRRAVENRDNRAVGQRIEEAGFRRDGRRYAKANAIGLFALQQSLRGTQVLYARDPSEELEPVLTIQVREPIHGQQVWPPYMMSERNQTAAALGFIHDLEGGGRAAWHAVLGGI